MTFKIARLTTLKASLLQAFSLVAYVSFAGVFMWRANSLLGPIDNWVGPIMFLTFFSFSVLVCGLTSLAYPVWLIWDQKDVQGAVRVIALTTLWLAVFFGLLLLSRLV